jgi:hypothetical protein
MSFESSLHDWLLSRADLSALIGDRMYPREAPQGVALPYVVRTRVSDPGQHHLGGRALIGNPRYQFDVFGDTSESARAVSEALRVALDGLVRCPLDATETIYECRLDGEVDSYEPNADGSEGGLFRQILDFLFWHKRS